MLNKSGIRIDGIEIEYINASSYDREVQIPQYATVYWSAHTKGGRITGEQEISKDMIDIEAIREHVFKNINGETNIDIDSKSLIKALSLKGLR